MRILFTLLRKDTANFVRDKAALSLTFLVPLALIYLMGHVFGLNRKESGPNGIRLAVVNQSTEPAAQKLVDALTAEKAFRVQTTRKEGKSEVPLTESDVRQMIHKSQLRFAVVLPADLIRDDAVGLRLKILSNPQNDIESQTVNGLLQKTLFSNVPELLGQSLQRQARRHIGETQYAWFNNTMADTIVTAFGGNKDDVLRGMNAGDFGLSALRNANGTPNNGSNRADALGDIVKIENETVVGQSVKSPAATRMVGGWAVMFLLFALSGSATAFFEEKKTGIFQRLLSAPVHRSQLLLSRFLFGICLGLVQLLTLFIGGRLLYGIDVFGNFGNLLVVSTATAAACTAFGMLLVSITPTAAAASGLATFLVLMMSACGGAWFPVSFLPPFMQEVAKFTLVYWALEGFSQVLWARQSFFEILPTIGILAGIAAVVMTLAIWRFNRGRLFE